MKKWRYTGDEAISDLRSECHSIEEVKVKKIGEKWIIRLYTYLGSVFELTVADIKERPVMENEKYMDWVEEEGEEKGEEE